jgi:uncharacterized protein (DUF779 family)
MDGFYESGLGTVTLPRSICTPVSAPGDIMVAPIIATQQAIELIEALRAEFGDILFHQSDGCMDGSGAHCYKMDEIPIGAGEIKFGEIAGVPFYIGPRLYESWRTTQVIIDVGPGCGDDSFSLESRHGCHFVNRWRVRDEPVGTEAPLPPSLG